MFGQLQPRGGFMRVMKFNVSEIKGGAGGKYRPILQCGDAIMPEEFVSIFAGAINKPEPYASFILGMLRETIASQLQAGRPVNLGWLSFTPRLKGALGTKDARGNSERLEVVSTPSRAFRRCLRGMDVVNVNEVHDPLLYEFLEDGQKNKNTLHDPGRRIVLNGDKISIDASHADEGVWLETPDGKVVASGQVVHSDAATCDLKFPKLPKKPGPYVFVLSCRNGRGCDFEAKRVTRCVTVR